MSDIGKVLIGLGLLLVLLGGLLVIGGRLNLPLGRLPGDIVYRGKNTNIYFPIVTSILLSILVSLVLWLFSRR